MTSEPCLACGYETAIGTPFYPGRMHVLRPDGTPIYLCSECSGLVRTGQLLGLEESDLLRLRESLPPSGVLATVGRR